MLRPFCILCETHLKVDLLYTPMGIIISANVGSQKAKPGKEAIAMLRASYIILASFVIILAGSVVASAATSFSFGIGIGGNPGGAIIVGTNPYYYGYPYSYGAYGYPYIPYGYYPRYYPYGGFYYSTGGGHRYYGNRYYGHGYGRYGYRRW